MTTGADELLGRVLRLGSEPCTSIGEMEVHRRLTAKPLDYLAWLKDELAAIAHGRAAVELPPKQIFPDSPGDADFRVMPCVVRQGTCVRKTVKVIGTNTRQITVPDQITVGKALVVDPVENFVSHVIDACLLSSARTGACAAIAAELLASARSSVAVIGAGRVGYYSALYLASCYGVGRITLADSDPQRAQQTTRLLASQVAGVEFRAETMAELSGIDVLVLATTSIEPLCRPPASGARLVISLGADTDYQRELASEWTDLADLYVDTLDSARFGDLAAWIRAGRIGTDRLTDLLTVLRTQPWPAPTRTRLFVSTGSALFDNLSIGYLLARA